MDQKRIFCASFDGKSLNLKILSKILSQKNFNQTIQQLSSISKGNNNTLSLKTLIYFKLY